MNGGSAGRISPHLKQEQFLFVPYVTWKVLVRSSDCTSPQGARMRRVWTWLGWGSAIAALWVAALQADLSEAQRGVIQALPIWALVVFGCYSLSVVGYEIMFFPACPDEAEKLQKDIRVATAYLNKHGISVSK
ncbi:dolichyl-phosphate mannosyltransferase polypeptide 3 [Klebsormidium nitens]|uniref:Dolichol-phosphate mannosyltransferase subunit 3 n=1 Tax=Klebsormidium nitens TaxID=105231 RepID=A0A1Y1IFG9_KLENI|nr:dolichyl-phosphate mannosyltransferase polypeptide 3 [Klebsormidium nitens]|eukprot:GAQ86858.1 dolichyl-phosphate mannosyltransferase polypeptide 3 [Klebsormidium nitens]